MVECSGIKKLNKKRIFESVGNKRFGQRDLLKSKGLKSFKNKKHTFIGKGKKGMTRILEALDLI